MKTTLYIFLILFIVSFVFTMPLKSQNLMGLYFMETIPQSQQLNPAFQPRANGFFALPSVNLMTQSDVAFNDIFQEKGNQWVTPLSQQFDYSELYNVIGNAANFNQYLNVDLMGFGFRSGKDYFTFSMGIRSVMQSSIAADLFKMVEMGFPDGESFDFSPTRIKQAVFHQLAFGCSRHWNQHLTLGIKIKPLFGIIGGVTDIDRLRLNTSRNQWDLMVAGAMHTSAPFDVEEGTPGDFPESVEARDLSDDEMADYLSSLSNTGIAFDFGAEYQLNNSWTFSVALNDLGYVKFKDDLNSLSFKGTYSFDGINAEGTDGDEIEQAFEDIGDSIKTIIDYDVTHEKFNIPLTSSLYVGASYQWTPAVSFGLLSGSVFQKNGFRQDFCLSANLQPYSFMALNFNYSKRIKGENGLGMTTAFLFGPLQFFLAANYIPLHYADVYFDEEEDAIPMAYRQKDLNISFGLNLIFGRHGNRDKPLLD
ncbi:DUF5723 family protein [Thermophagus sp. OGC60D27]|uniref:DUF5723 family protein n=1 Tax=Thermophagus sp. OGC60D27 TaxID=3458415 RepID=UPI00403837BC